jgi:hypothetical protein
MCYGCSWQGAAVPEVCRKQTIKGSGGVGKGLLCGASPHRRSPAISGPSALSPNFLQSGHASSSINGQPYSGAKGEPLREVAQI